MKSGCAKVMAAVGVMVVLAAYGKAIAAGKPQTLNEVTKVRVGEILDGLEKDGDYAGAEGQLSGVFDQVALTGTDGTLDAFRDSAFALRMVRQLEKMPEAKRGELLKYLRANDSLARTLAFLILDEKQVEGAYGVLDRLREKHGEELNKYAQLAAAICVVHDKPFMRRINENKTVSPDAAAIFEYYTRNEKYMLFPIKNVPAELLVYVVDTTSPIAEMEWALKRYAGDQAVGRHFFDIKYDEESFRKGTEKKVDAAGYSLPNVLKFGGVCADQAFFAMEIGKAIGVPTTYTTASSAEVGHAWIGFLQAQGGTPPKGVWNFDVGRYEEYRGVRGDVEDPQTREDIPDSYVSLLAELIGKSAADRQAAVALTDAALRLANAADGEEALKPAALAPSAVVSQAGSDGRATTLPSQGFRQVRKPTTDAALELLQSALNQNKAFRPAWFVVAELAQANKLTMAQKALWSSVLLKMCGEKYPDFALTVLEPMIGSVKDPAQQDHLWQAAAVKFTGRSDLSAEILMNEAEVWEQQGQTARAGALYLEVVDRYCNAGPFVIPALAKAEALLGDKKEKVVRLYQQSWAKIEKPEDMAGPFMEQSNWFRVGAMYAEKLAAAGDEHGAAAVYDQLGVKAANSGQ